MGDGFKFTIGWVWIYAVSAVAVIIGNFEAVIREYCEVLYYDYFRIIDPRFWSWIVPFCAWLLLAWVFCFLILDHCPRLYSRRWRIWITLVIFGTLAYQRKAIWSAFCDRFFWYIIEPTNFYVHFGVVSLSLQIYLGTLIVLFIAAIVYSQYDNDGKFLRRLIRGTGSLLYRFFVK